MLSFINQHSLTFISLICIDNAHARRLVTQGTPKITSVPAIIVYFHNDTLQILQGSEVFEFLQTFVEKPKQVRFDDTPRVTSIENLIEEEEDVKPVDVRPAPTSREKMQEAVQDEVEFVMHNTSPGSLPRGQENDMTQYQDEIFKKITRREEMKSPKQKPREDEDVQWSMTETRTHPPMQAPEVERERDEDSNSKIKVKDILKNVTKLEN